eukprot:gb/GEZN01012670.1/.p1 GENE.gb/GEZN01012670.1/~~gb/GEZN01012670.1/.p1  ORF type:complete len:210 (-),score=6.79 gb/GEZN01012670.1/:347-976(-)
MMLLLPVLGLFAHGVRGNSDGAPICSSTNLGVINMPNTGKCPGAPMNGTNCTSDWRISVSAHKILAGSSVKVNITNFGGEPDAEIVGFTLESKATSGIGSFKTVTDKTTRVKSSQGGGDLCVNQEWFLTHRNPVDSESLEVEWTAPFSTQNFTVTFTAIVLNEFPHEFLNFYVAKSATLDVIAHSAASRLMPSLTMAVSFLMMFILSQS